jgi:hypothetical protein
MFQAGLAILFSIPMWSLLNVPSMSWSIDTNDYLIIAGLIMLLHSSVRRLQINNYIVSSKILKIMAKQWIKVYGDIHVTQTISLNGCIGLLIPS